MKHLANANYRPRYQKDATGDEPHDQSDKYNGLSQAPRAYFSGAGRGCINRFALADMTALFAEPSLISPPFAQLQPCVPR